MVTHTIAVGLLLCLLYVAHSTYGYTDVEELRRTLESVPGNRTFQQLYNDFSHHRTVHIRLNEDGKRMHKHIEDDVTEKRDEDLDDFADVIRHRLAVLDETNSAPFTSLAGRAKARRMSHKVQRQLKKEGKTFEKAVPKVMKRRRKRLDKLVKKLFVELENGSENQLSLRRAEIYPQRRTHTRLRHRKQARDGVHRMGHRVKNPVHHTRLFSETGLTELRAKHREEELDDGELAAQCFMYRITQKLAENDAEEEAERERMRGSISKHRLNHLCGEHHTLKPDDEVSVFECKVYNTLKKLADVKEEAEKENDSGSRARMRARMDEHRLKRTCKHFFEDLEDAMDDDDEDEDSSSSPEEVESSEESASNSTEHHHRVHRKHHHRRAADECDEDELDNQFEDLFMALLKATDDDATATGDSDKRRGRIRQRIAERRKNREPRRRHRRREAEETELFELDTAEDLLDVLSRDSKANKVPLRKRMRAAIDQHRVTHPHRRRHHDKEKDVDGGAKELYMDEVAELVLEVDEEAEEDATNGAARERARDRLRRRISEHRQKRDQKKHHHRRHKDKSSSSSSSSSESVEDAVEAHNNFTESTQPHQGITEATEVPSQSEQGNTEAPPEVSTQSEEGNATNSFAVDIAELALELTDLRRKSKAEKESARGRLRSRIDEHRANREFKRADRRASRLYVVDEALYEASLAEDLADTLTSMSNTAATENRGRIRKRIDAHRAAHPRHRRHNGEAQELYIDDATELLLTASDDAALSDIRDRAVTRLRKLIDEQKKKEATAKDQAASVMTTSDEAASGKSDADADSDADSSNFAVNIAEDGLDLVELRMKGMSWAPAGAKMKARAGARKGKRAARKYTPRLYVDEADLANDVLAELSANSSPEREKLRVRLRRRIDAHRATHPHRKRKHYRHHSSDSSDEDNDEKRLYVDETAELIFKADDNKETETERERARDRLRRRIDEHRETHPRKHQRHRGSSSESEEDDDVMSTDFAADISEMALQLMELRRKDKQKNVEPVPEAEKVRGRFRNRIDEHSAKRALKHSAFATIEDYDEDEILTSDIAKMFNGLIAADDSQDTATKRHRRERVRNRINERREKRRLKHGRGCAEETNVFEEDVAEMLLELAANDKKKHDHDSARGRLRDRLDEHKAEREKLKAEREKEKKRKGKTSSEDDELLQEIRDVISEHIEDRLRKLIQQQYDGEATATELSDLGDETMANFVELVLATGDGEETTQRHRVRERARQKRLELREKRQERRERRHQKKSGPEPNPELDEQIDEKIDNATAAAIDENLNETLAVFDVFAKHFRKAKRKTDEVKLDLKFHPKAMKCDIAFEVFKSLMENTAEQTNTGMQLRHKAEDDIRNDPVFHGIHDKQLKCNLVMDLFSKLAEDEGEEEKVKLRTRIRNRLDERHVKREFKKMRRHANKELNLMANMGTEISCTNTVSKVIPTSVDRLRPGDIKVVAAIGDSLTAANGAAGERLLQILLEYRGVSFSIGGDHDLNSMTTLPNILQQLNGKDLVGASHQIAPSWYKELSQLNVAVAGATSADLLSQAKELLNRLKERKDINFVNDWKLITVFIGANDVCNSCKEPDKYGVEQWTENLVNALKYLADNVPRAYVNLVDVLNVNRLIELHNSDTSQSKFCRIIHNITCPCVLNETAGSDWSRALVRDYQDAAKAIVESGQLERDNFTVVLQPFFDDFEIPKVISPKTGKAEPDFSYFAPDCFHISVQAHDVAAKALWDNMISPVGAKSKFLKVENYADGAECPPEDCPYLRTAANSKVCNADERDDDRLSDDEISDLKQPISDELTPLLDQSQDADEIEEPLLDTELYRQAFWVNSAWVQAPQEAAGSRSHSGSLAAILGTMLGVGILGLLATIVIYHRKINNVQRLDSVHTNPKLHQPSYGGVDGDVIGSATTLQSVYNPHWQAEEAPNGLWTRITRVFRKQEERYPLLEHPEPVSVKIF